MIALVRCPNPRCGHPSRASLDPPGRIFRCPSCRTKLTGGTALMSDPEAPSPRHAVTALSAGFTSPSGELSRRCGTRPEPGDPPLGDGRVLRVAALTTPGMACRTEPEPSEDPVDPPDLLSLIEPCEEEAGPIRLANLDKKSARWSDLRGKLSRYRVLGILGEGQSARVYRAYDPILERTVALKVLHPGSPRADGLRERFLREARAMARLTHPRIVPVLEVGCDDGSYFIAMGLVEGESLATICEESSHRLGMRRAVEIVADLSEALDHAHRQGIIHRDVKPANIQIDRAGQAHLMDFGIAFRSEAADDTADDSTRTGTPAYVAPELARGLPAIAGPACDQYSLGVVLYELLCGRTPFIGPPLYVLYQAANEPPPSPRAVEPSVPAGLSDICLKTLAKRPEGRYHSCDELAADLRRWLEKGAASRNPATWRRRLGGLARHHAVASGY